MGFNSKREDPEIYGENDAIDFGARIYDLRLGRWMKTDDREAKYPGITPYNFSFNSPLAFNDNDGKDGRVKVIQNENGGGQITIQSTIHFYGANAAEWKEFAEKNFNEINRVCKYYDSHGNEWSVQINLEFKVSPQFENITEGRWGPDMADLLTIDDFKPGDNVVDLNIHPNDGSLESAMWGGYKTFAFGKTGVLHGIFHNLGFNDNYNDVEDIMYGITKDPPTYIADYHFWDAASNILEKFELEKSMDQIDQDATTFEYDYDRDAFDHFEAGSNVNRTQQAQDQAERKSNHQAKKDTGTHESMNRPGTIIKNED